MHVCPCGEVIYTGRFCDDCELERKPRKVVQGSPDDGLRPDESCSTTNE